MNPLPRVLQMLTLPAFLLLLLPCSVPATSAAEAPAPDGRRPGATLLDTRPAAPLGNEQNTDRRRERSYPEQPPTIPHSTQGYRIDLYSNKCLSCHSRVGSVSAQAPMVSISHYRDRGGRTLATVAPRRYFCNACHVPQQDVTSLPGNHFETIDQLLKREAYP